jgi:hypothetical protein
LAHVSDPYKHSASTLYEHRLTQRELSTIHTPVDEWTQSVSSVEAPEFADACSLSARQSPRRLRELAPRFKYLHLSCGAVQLRGEPVDDAGIGPSPKHWDAPWRNPPNLRADVTPCLLTAAMGDIFGCRTQENGRFLRHIVSIEKALNAQLDEGSTFVLMICDGGEKYLDTVFHDAWMDERDLLDTTVVKELDQLVEQLTVHA